MCARTCPRIDWSVDRAATLDVSDFFVEPVLAVVTEGFGFTVTLGDTEADGAPGVEAEADGAKRPAAGVPGASGRPPAGTAASGTSAGRGSAEACCPRPITMNPAPRATAAEPATRV
ncbi:hypothetical protein L3i22_086450 [Actinoplanes sp. L3-i22]|nr:hypothetical protein L3i22_086450 [Actinoplanes sp. L3-i22]